MAFVSVYFSLGSNLGDRTRNLETALERLDDALGCHWTALSRVIETKAWGFRGAKFLNAAVMYRIFREPDAEAQALSILDACKRIEKEMGRDETVEYDADGRRIYHSRTIDIDILFFGAERMALERLTIPHPLMTERDFVMIPLREIAKPSLRASFPEIFETK